MKVDYIELEYSNVLNTCIDGIKNKDKKLDFQSIKLKLLNDKKIYIKYACLSNFQLIKKHTLHSNRLTIDNHSWLYSTRLLKNKDCRIYYDKIITNQDICLYCGIRDSETLDHFLSKSIYPNYSILPENLIPCCSKCNTAKGDIDKNSLQKADYFLHPYFDDFNNIRWINGYLDIIENKLFFDFYLDSAQLNDNEYKRIESMVIKIELRELYIRKASIKFKRDEKYLFNLYNKNGIIELEDMFKSHYNYLNAVDENDFEKTYYLILLNNINILLKYFKNKK